MFNAESLCAAIVDITAMEAAIFVVLLFFFLLFFCHQVLKTNDDKNPQDWLKKNERFIIIDYLKCKSFST